MRAENQKKFFIFREMESRSAGKLDKFWLNRYYSLGLKACMLAGAGMFCVCSKCSRLTLVVLGSFYFLVLIAIGRLRTTLSMLTGSSTVELAKLLRFPDGKNPYLCDNSLKTHHHQIHLPGTRSNSISSQPLLSSVKPFPSLVTSSSRTLMWMCWVDVPQI